MANDLPYSDTKINCLDLLVWRDPMNLRTGQATIMLDPAIYHLYVLEGPIDCT